MKAVRQFAPDFLALLFGTSSLVHLFRPRVFEPLIPAWLPNPRVIVYASGLAEVICAAGLVKRASWARPASILLLLAVFPGNVQMAFNTVDQNQGRGPFTARELLAFGRLPLQIPLIWAAAQATPAKPIWKWRRWPAHS